MLASNRRPPSCRDGTGWVGGAPWGRRRHCFSCKTAHSWLRAFPARHRASPLSCTSYVRCRLTLSRPSDLAADRLPLPGVSRQDRRPERWGSYDRQRFERGSRPTSSSATPWSPARQGEPSDRPPAARGPTLGERRGWPPDFLGLTSDEWRDRKVADAAARSAARRTSKRSPHRRLRRDRIPRAANTPTGKA